MSALERYDPYCGRVVAKVCHSQYFDLTKNLDLVGESGVPSRQTGSVETLVLLLVLEGTIYPQLEAHYAPEIRG